MDYPEHEKMAAVKAKSQAIGAFLEWMSEQGIQRMVWVEEGVTEEKEDVFHTHGGKPYTVAYTLSEWRYHGGSIESLLARYFEIDLAKIEQENLAMLAEVRALNGGKP